MNKINQNLKGFISIGLLVLIVGTSILAPIIAPVSPYKQSLDNAFLPPFHAVSNLHYFSLLGTDQLGRDVFTRLLYGGQVSLLMAVISVLVSATIGAFVGIVAGFYGGKTDNILMRLADIQLSIPSLLLAIVLVAVLGANFFSIVFVLAVTGWVPFARILRSRVLTLKELDFIRSAQIMGVPNRLIIWRHLLPNLRYLFFTQMALQMSRMILLAASLSFLGLGLSVSTPTWGGMINEGREYITSAWWLSIFPCLIIAVTLFSVNLLSDYFKERQG